MNGHTWNITCILYCPELSRVITTSGWDKTARVWDVATGKCVHVLRGHTYGVQCAAVHGTTLVTGSSDDTVRVWNLQTGECTHTLKGHTSCVRCVAFNGTTIVSGSRDRTLRIWRAPYNRASLQLIEPDTAHTMRQMNGHTGEIRCIVHCPELSRVITGSDDKTARVWNVATGKCVNVLNGHTDDVYCAAVHGTTLVTGSADGTVRMWDMQTGECTHTFSEHTSSVECVAFDGTTIVSGSGDETVRIWHAPYNTAELVTGSRDKTVRVWDVRTGECTHTLKGHTDCVRCVAFDGATIVSGSYDKTVRIWRAPYSTAELRVWDVRTGECTHTLNGHTNSVWCVAFDGTTIVSGSHDRTVRIWRAPYNTAECERVIEGHTNYVRCVWLCTAPNEHIVVSADSDKRLLLIDPDTAHTIRQMNGHTAGITCIVHCPELSRVITGSGDKTVRVWDVATGECVHVLNGHTGSVTCAAVHGTRLVTGSWDHTVRVWNVRTGECTHTLNRHAYVYCVAFDGTIIVSGGSDNTVRIWSAPYNTVECGHVRQIVQLENGVREIVASSTRFMCSYDNEKKVAIVHFDDEK
ncbi:unnamed protein product [Sphagnum balticum]